MKNQAKRVIDEYYLKLGPGPYYYDNLAVAAALRETINVLQISPGMIVAPDMLKLAEEIEDL